MGFPTKKYSFWWTRSNNWTKIKKKFLFTNFIFIVVDWTTRE